MLTVNEFKIGKESVVKVKLVIKGKLFKLIVFIPKQSLIIKPSYFVGVISLPYFKANNPSSVNVSIFIFESFKELIGALVGKINSPIGTLTISTFCRLGQ